MAPLRSVISPPSSSTSALLLGADPKGAVTQQEAVLVVHGVEEEGVATNRIDYKGLGEKEPIASNETEKGRAQNRRTTFKVVGL